MAGLDSVSWAFVRGGLLSDMPLSLHQSVPISRTPSLISSISSTLPYESSFYESLPLPPLVFSSDLPLPPLPPIVLSPDTCLPSATSALPFIEQQQQQHKEIVSTKNQVYQQKKNHFISLSIHM